MKYYMLWLDDLRNPFKAPWTSNIKSLSEDMEVLDDVMWVRSYDEFVAHIEIFGLPALISFDHDLGDVKEQISLKQGNGHTEKTGMDCAKYLIDRCLDTGEILPEFSVHSQNPVGKANLEALLHNYCRTLKRIKDYGK